MEIIPRRKPKEGPNTRALNINKNHIGSIPTAPAPNGRSAATRAESTPRSATDFASILELEISEIESTTATVIASAKKI
jgi:hypothetical protein